MDRVPKLFGTRDLNSTRLGDCWHPIVSKTAVFAGGGQDQHWTLSLEEEKTTTRMKMTMEKKSSSMTLLDRWRNPQNCPAQCGRGRVWGVSAIELPAWSLASGQLVVHDDAHRA